MSFGLNFYDLTPTLRLSGDSIAFVRKFTKVGGQGSGRNGIEIGLTDDAELKLLEGNSVDGYIPVADRDVAYSTIVANGMVEIVADEMALSVDAISRIQTIGNVLEIGIAGSQPRIRFEQQAVDGIKRVNDTLYHLPASSFSALSTSAASYQSTVKERITEVIAAYVAADSAIVDGVDFTGRITAPATDNVVPFLFANQAAFPDASTVHGAVAHSHADGAIYFAHAGMWHKLANDADLLSTIASLDNEANTRAAADTALSDRLDVLEADPTTAAALAAVQADVDQNEADADAAIAAEATARAAADTAAISTANAYTDTSITNLVNGADAALDTLREIGDALAQGDTDVTAALTAQITTEATTRADEDAAEATARANADSGLSARLDTLEADPTTQTLLAAESATRAAGDTALSGRLDVLEADPTTAAAVAAVQADVDQNESDSDAAEAALSDRLDALEADPTTATSVAAVQADVDQNEADADAADAALSDRLDVLEADPTTAAAVAAANAARATGDADEAALRVAADAALSARLDTLEVDPTTASAVAAVQSDVDQNEADADAAIAVERGRIDAILASADADKDSFAEIVSLINSVDTANDNAFAAYVLSNDAAVAAVQADVDQNESDSDAAEAALSARLDTLEADPTTAAAVAAVQADVDQNEADSDAAEAALSGRLDVLEADSTTATAVAAVQADVDQNEADADAALALKAPLADPDFTGQLEVDTNARLEFDSNNLTKLTNVLRGTDIEIGNNITLNPAAANGRVEIEGGLYLRPSDLVNAANDTAAAAAGVIVGQIYHNNGDLKVRLS